MKSRIDKVLGRISKSGIGAQEERLRSAASVAQLEDHRRALLESPRNADDRRLLKYGYRVYSQSDEDGILHEILHRIGDGGRRFVEIGAGDGFENNTLFLLIQGWRGVWIEGSSRKVTGAKKHHEAEIAEGRLQVVEQYATAANIDETIKRFSPGELDVLSVDIDGNDYYVLGAIRAVAPRVIVAEYNAKFPPDVRWIMEHNEAHRWDSTDYFGASLKALEILLLERGYFLVGCNLLGTNAFFIRKDLVRDPPFCAPFSAENHYEPARYFLLQAFHSGFPAGFGPYRSREDKEMSR
ncbi:MAG TPA: FkbM family methyltransferase [Candidatus Angelobacter sp.]|jgi:hypothetical protein|nr:FkbM family methyltransferase [Candidatus Angelobacter sp.]